MRGRTVGPEEIRHVREVAGLCTGLSRHELALTLCEHWGWFGATGKPQRRACEYLSASNLLDVFGEVAFTGAALARMAELAIEHREHWAEQADKWTAAVQVARECGAEAARQSTRPIPE